MAIVKNFWLKNNKKRLGGAVIYQAMGQTRSRELAASVSNPRTQSQMNQRVKWSNLVNFYRVNAGWMKFAYETKKTNQSEYNKFMSLNVSNSRIYIPKGLASQGACIVDAYQMTQGSLASIEITGHDGGWQTNIYLDKWNTFDINVTIAEMSQSILAANPAIREGDQLSFLRFTQQTNAQTGVPFVIVRKYEVIINSSDYRRFYDFMPFDYVVFDGTASGGWIQIEDSGNAGGWLMVLSRTVGGKTYVSSQSIVVANNDTLINAYSSSNALQTAIDSYGESAEPFLTSTTAEEDSQAGTRPSILSVKIGSQTFVPGTRAEVSLAQGNVPIEITFSQNMTGATGEEIAVNCYSGGELVELASQTRTSTISGNKMTNNIVVEEALDAVIADVLASTDVDDYRAVFAITNADTIEGLE